MIDGYVYGLSSLRTEEEGFVYLGETSARLSLYCFHFVPVVWLHVADIYICIYIIHKRISSLQQCTLFVLE